MRTPSQSASSKRRPVGRPTKKTEETIEALMRVIATGAPYMICCAATGVSYDSFMTWKREDLEFAARVEEASAKAALRLLAKIEKQGDENFAASSWILERRWPEIFSRPEVQLNLQTNVVQNNLTITIAPEELREIEAQAAPVREKVRQMVAAYRPGALGNGNGSGACAGDIQAEPVGKPEDLAPITTKGDKPDFPDNRDMLKMMAHENMEEWGTSAIVEIETLEAYLVIGLFYAGRPPD
jgi:hypothetical protein